MDKQIDGPLGLVVLYESASPEIDIVAVHGLGANPAWAWVSKSGDQNINWLADRSLLPLKLPESRIMTFNYESRWHSNAPWQRRYLCAEQLLTALDIERKKDATYRPLLFIGHSFGGIVIEQALLNASIHGGSFQSLATSTVGVVFLGTPHRGTKASKWGEIIAKTGAAFGFSTESRILQDLRQDSEALTDLLYDFTLWLFRSSVSAVCFFEQHKTDYGRRLGGLFTWKELVVDERSACIDGHRKVALPTDHLKINKFSGSQDPAFKVVAPIIAEMAQDALKRIDKRLNPRDMIQDYSIVPREHMGCLRSLLLTNPEYDLANVRRMKGERTHGTCEWLLATEEYSSWWTGTSPQILQLIGDAGIGKTMISTFVVDEFLEKARQNDSITFAYYFCDNKVDTRKTSTAVLRGLLFQLLRQRPKLFKKIQDDYDVMQNELRDNFDALATNLRAMLRDPDAGEVYLLVDAVDECDDQSLRELLHTFTELFLDPRKKMSNRSKLIITHRPQTIIESSLRESNWTLRIDSGTINTDLAKFIDNRVELLSRSREYSRSLEAFVKSTLKAKAGGTFLWASLVLDDLGKTDSNGDVRNRLDRLPSTLYEVYDRILGRIRGESIKNAILLLRLMVVARRPLTVDEVAMACSLSLEQRERNGIPLEDTWQDRKDVFKCCDALLYRDHKNDTINFVHQSVKDYLTSDDYLLAQPDLGKFYVVAEKADHLIFMVCWTYLGREKSDSGRRESKIGLHVMATDNKGCLVPLPSRAEDSLDHVFLRYAADHYWEHALAAGQSFVAHEWKPNELDQLPILRDWLLLQAARGGKVPIVATLLQNRAHVNAKAVYGETAIHWAAGRGHVRVVDLLLEKSNHFIAQDDDGRTALHWAICKSKKAVVDRIATHKKVLFLPIQDRYGWTALHLAVRMAEWDADANEMVRILLDNDADPNIQSRSGRTALHEVAIFGRVDLARLLLDHGAKADVGNEVWKTVVGEMTESAFQSMMKLLSQEIGYVDRSRTLYLDYWQDIRPGLSKIFMDPRESVGVKLFMQMHNAIHNYCTLQQTRQEILRGEDLYNGLRDYLLGHLKELKATLESQSDKEIMPSYVKEWTRYVRAATKIDGIFRYLNLHWITRELDKGKTSIFPVYELHLVQWRMLFLQDANGKITSCVRKTFDRRRNGDTVDVSMWETVLESVVLSSFSDSVINNFVHGSGMEVARDAVKSYLCAPDRAFQIQAEALKTIVQKSNHEILTLVFAVGPQGVQHITRETMAAAAGNYWNGAKITRLLLDRYGDDIQITPEVVVAAAGNDGKGEEITRLLLDRYGNIQITPKVLVAAARNGRNGAQIMELLLKRHGDNIQITPEVVVAAAGNDGNGEEITRLLLDRYGNIQITPEVLVAAARNGRNGTEIMKLLLERHGDNIQITPEVVMAAEGNDGKGEEITRLLLERYGDIQIIPEALAAAARNGRNGTEIMKLLLVDRYGNGILITPEVVVAAEGNDGKGKGIMRLPLDRYGDNIQITSALGVAAARVIRKGEEEILGLLIDRYLVMISRSHQKWLRRLQEMVGTARKS